MKQFLQALIIILFNLSTNAQVLQNSFSMDFIGTSHTTVGNNSHTFNTLNRGMVLDEDNNIYYANFVGFSNDFDPSENEFFLGSDSGSKRPFLVKYNSDGEFIWGFTLDPSDTSRNPEIYDIVLDSSNNIIVLGDFYGTIDFDPSENVEERTIINASVNGSTKHVFVAKYDSNGNFISVFTIGIVGNTGPHENDPRMKAIEIDDNDNIYLAGTPGGYIDFDPDENSNFIVGGLPFSTDVSALYAISKYNSVGEFQWTIPLIRQHIDESFVVRDIAIDNIGNISIIGNFNANVDFDPSDNEFILTSATIGNHNSRKDFFLAKYNNQGALLYAKNYNTDQNDSNSRLSTFRLAYDDFNNLYISGSFKNTIDFDLGDGEEIVIMPDQGFNFKSAGFISKYDINNNHLWTKTFIPEFNNSVNEAFIEFNDLSITASQELIVTGEYKSSMLDLDPDQESAKNITSNGNSDVFFFKLDANGEFNWGASIGGNGVDSGFLAYPENNSNNLWLLGDFLSNNVDLDLHPNNEVLLFKDQWDEKQTFFAKYSTETLSIPDYQVNNLKIYPNPVGKLDNYRVNINYNSSFLNYQNSTLYDIYGKMILTTTESFVDTHNLLSGIYLLQINCEEKSKVVKLIIE